MILCLPFCAKDGALAIANLEWIAELDPALPYHCLLSHDDSTPPAIIERMSAMANRTFQKVSVMWYPTPEKKYWPAAPNWAFQNAARYVAHFFPQDSWLFLEADATPIRKGWLQALEEAHIKGGKAISGHVVDGLGHPNGVAIYPPMVSAYSQQAMTVEETAWDVVIGATVDKEHIHNIGIGAYDGQPSRHLIQHCWNMDEKTGEPTNGHGYSPTFKSVDEVVRKIDLNAAIYHRCKDGSLIRFLREFYQAPHKAMVPNHTKHDEKPTERDAEDVRRHGDVVADTASTVHNPPEPAAPPFTGKCEIFIVTYGLPTKRASGLVVSDFDWLTWCLRCIRKHCTGFSGITLAIPSRDAALLQPIANEHAQAKGGIPMKIKMFHEKPGKGMLFHMGVIGSSDEFVPAGTDYVLHLDSDCMAREPVTPAEYVVDGKPVYVIRSYESLIDAASKTVSDCHQWKAVAEANIGMPIEQYAMLRHPSCFPIDFYKKFRTRVEEVHQKPFMDYVLSCRNEFPQTYAEFPAQGGFAYATMKDRFKWLDVSGGNHLAPKDKFKVFWSHAGVVPDVQKEIESFLV